MASAPRRHQLSRLRTPPRLGAAVCERLLAPSLELWAHRILAWAHGETPPAEPSPLEAINPARRLSSEAAARAPRDVLVFFDNDIKVRAPFDAIALQQRLHELLALP